MKKYLFIVLLVGVWSCEDEEDCEEIYELRIDTWLTYDMDDSCNTSNYSLSYRDTPLPSRYLKLENNLLFPYAHWSNEETNEEWLQHNGVGISTESFIFRGDSLITVNVNNNDSCSYDISSFIMSDSGWCMSDTEAEMKEIYVYDCSLYSNKYVKICNPYQIGIPE
ncbi:MAG: hypothetical protein ACJZ1Y_02745 [Candidatus Neomarinimicrobiota bacterium]